MGKHKCIYYSLDRLMTIQRVTEVITATGERYKTWNVLMADVPVSVEYPDFRYREEMDGKKETSYNTVVFITRWANASNATEKDRILYSGTVHEIKAIQEIGRQDYVKISCQISK